MIPGVFGLLTGGGFSLIGEIFKGIKDSRDQARNQEHERKMSLQELEAQKVMQGMISETALNTTILDNDTQLRLTSMKNDIQDAKGASQWVINFRAFARPLGLYFSFLYYLIMTPIFIFHPEHIESITSGLVALGVHEVISAIVSHYYVGRGLRKMFERNHV